MRKVQRRRFCLYTVVIVLAQLLAFEASAQSYPNKPVRIVAGSAPGGGNDTISRLLAPKLSEYLGQPVIVENRPGASGVIATERVALSPPDGYTLQMIVSSTLIVVALRADLPFDLERDLAPVSLASSLSLVLMVHPSVPARNVKELIALARSRPGKLDFGSTGVGSAAHLAGELFNSMAKIKLVNVPYKGSAGAVVATVAGEIPISFPSLSAALPLLGTGKIRLLAVTSAKRSSLTPSIPTLDESGVPGYDHTVWYGVLAPAAVPKDILAQLNAAILKLNTAEMKEAVIKGGQELQTSSSAQFAAFIRSEIAKNAKLIKLIGLKPE
ncbi:MAG: tripartite tricarboxylate transporter substrate binding protein [Betaproteobacteria bacterium]|nr:tripartite tricarboxylate transporter substrate binding protein [Betaproteobacteria bacterium]